MIVQGADSSVSQQVGFSVDQNKTKITSDSDEFSKLAQQMITAQETDLPEDLDQEEHERAIDYAKLASQAYGESDFLVVDMVMKLFGDIDHIKEQEFDTPNYQKIGQKGGIDWPHTSGLDYTVFENKETGDVVVSFRGTSPLSPIDLMEDFEQTVGGSEQYAEAVELAKQMQSDLDKYNEENGTDKELSFTGHSLGGGLATVAALATDNEAVVFDASGLSQATIDNNNLDLNNADKIKNFNVVDSELTDYNGKQDRTTFYSDGGIIPPTKQVGDVYWLDSVSDEADVGGWLIPEDSFIAKKAEGLLNHAMQVFTYQIENGNFAKSTVDRE